MLKVLDDYDWAEVFGEGNGGNCTPIIPNRPPFDKITNIASFTREDVLEVFGMAEGERDSEEWIVCGKLKDGRYFVARGGCDYTGWDCRAHNGGDVAQTMNQIVRFGLAPRERARVKLSVHDSEMMDRGD